MIDVICKRNFIKAILFRQAKVVLYIIDKKMWYALGGNTVRKAIFSTNVTVKVKMSLTLVSFEKVSLSWSKHVKYEVFISPFLVMMKVKVLKCYAGKRHTCTDTRTGQRQNDQFIWFEMLNQDLNLLIRCNGHEFSSNLVINKNYRGFTWGCKWREC